MFVALGAKQSSSNFYHKSHVISIIVFLSSQIDFVCQNFAHKLCTTGVCAAAATRIKSLMVGSGRGKGKGGSNNKCANTQFCDIRSHHMDNV